MLCIDRSVLIDGLRALLPEKRLGFHAHKPPCGTVAMEAWQKAKASSIGNRCQIAPSIKKTFLK
jgi:hypothetical protein